MKHIIFFFISLISFAGCELIDFGDKLLNKNETTEDDQSGKISESTFVSVDFIEGWTETRFGGDGTVFCMKRNDIGKMTEVLAIVPNEEYIYIPIFARFDENEIPSFISFWDTEIYIDTYTTSTIDFTLAVEDAVWTITGLECSGLTPNYVSTKAWEDNNAVRNLCAIGNIVVGSASVAGGVILIGASGIAEIGSAGLSTPISVPGIALGTINIIGGAEAISDGFTTIFGPGESSPNVSEYTKDGLMGIAMEKFCDWVSNSPKNEFIKKHFPESLLKESANIGKLGAATYWSGLAFSSIDELWGETYIDDVDIAKIHQNVNIVTGRYENVTSHSVKLYGYVTPLATCPLGIKVSNQIGIVIWNNKGERRNQMIEGSDGGIFSFNFDELTPNTEYCYRTFFYDKDNGKNRMGEICSFKTKEESDSDKWIDLGLSVLWAKWNVGANSPEEYGRYYAWGETEEKSSYDWENYKWKEQILGSNISGTKYDVAHVEWGNGARLPKLDEIKELRDKCSWEQNSKGVTVTGPNGNQINIPFASAMIGNKLHDDPRTCGFIWSGTAEEDDDNQHAFCLSFGHDIEHGWEIYCGDEGCQFGFSVRPVKDKVEIYGKWKPIAEFNNGGYYYEIPDSSYIEWLILNRDNTGSWDGETFDWTLDNMIFNFWGHRWEVVELTDKRLKMCATENGFSEGYIWERIEKY